MSKSRVRLTAMAGGLSLLLAAAAPSRAGSIEDATAGLDALKRSDFGTAVNLFGKAIAAGTLSTQDLELALVKRGEAYVRMNRGAQAVRDLDEALRLNPGDEEAKSLRDQAQDLADRSSPRTGIPVVLGEFGAWTAARLQEGEDTLCFVFTRPTASSPTIPGRGDVVLSITARFRGRSLTETSIAETAGFIYTNQATVTMEIDARQHDLVASGDSAFVQNAPVVLDALVTASRFSVGPIYVRLIAPRQKNVVDSFSLSGFAAAYQTLAPGCPVN